MCAREMNQDYIYNNYECGHIVFNYILTYKVMQQAIPTVYDYEQ